jgi:hypothetical protein
MVFLPFVHRVEDDDTANLGAFQAPGLQHGIIDRVPGAGFWSNNDSGRHGLPLVPHPGYADRGLGHDAA